jgi:hypothetical protein
VGFGGFVVVLVAVVVVLFVLVAARVDVGVETDTSVVWVGVVAGETVEGKEEFEGPRNA